MSDSIHRILEEIRDIEEAKTALVDELDRRIDARYQEVAPQEGEVWEVTLTSEHAHIKAVNIPAIRTAGGWVTDPKWEADHEPETLLDDYGLDCWWEDETVYPHHKLH